MNAASSRSGVESVGKPASRCRVLLVSPRYRPPLFRGGIERYVHMVAAELRELDYDCEIVSLAEDLPCESSLPHRYLSVPRVPFLRPLLFGLRGRNLWQGADVVSVQYTPLAAFVPKDRLVCTVHTTGHGEASALRTPGARAAPWSLMRRHLSIPFEGRILRRASRVVAISEHVAMELVDVYGVDRRRITVVGNGVDCEEFRPGGSPKGNVPLRILYVGRLAKRKNVDVLIRAARLLRSKIALRIVGTGPEQALLKALVAENGLSDVVEFRGFRAGKALLEEYQWADLLSVPSSYEGIPLAALEAKATGLPIVAAHFRGAEQVVTAASGLLLPSFKAEDFARAFDQLANDHPGLRRMAERARSEAVERFSWRAPVSRLAAVFDAVAQRSSIGLRGAVS